MLKVRIFKFWSSERDQEQEIEKCLNDNIYDWNNQVKSVTQSTTGSSTEGTMTILTIIWKE